MTRSYRLLAALLLLSCSDASSPTAPGPPNINPRALTSCSQVSGAISAELAYIQRCTRASECGQELLGTSCGCTRNLVARRDVDTARFYEILARGQALDCSSLGFGTICDCPPADGFACVANRCTWNYTGGG
jgi:hypothetical protein